MKSRKHYDKDYYIDRNADICRDRLEGMTFRELSEKYNLHQVTVRNIVKKRGYVKTDHNYFCEDLTELDIAYTVMPKQKNYGVL